MALVKVSDTCVINDYQQISQSSIVGQATESLPLSALTHHAWPGLTWSIKFYPRGDAKAKPNYASVFVKANFGPGKDSVASVWAEWTMTVVTGDAKAILRKTTLCRVYLLDGHDTWGFVDAFRQEALTSASALTDGKLKLKLDLTLFKIVDLLKCRESVRALLSENQHLADVTVVVEGKPFKAHKAFIANRCRELLDSASIPVGTTANAFEAFLGVIYCDKFDFHLNWKLALGVCKLAAKFGADYLKEFCDDAMADLVSSLDDSALLQLLPDALRCNASATKAACIRRLHERKDLWTSSKFTDFLTRLPTDMMTSILLGSFAVAAQCPKCEPACAVYRAAEITLSHSWSISKAALLNAVPPQPTFVQSPMLLEHKAFPLLKWQLEFHPRGNAQDPEHKQGYASLYLKAIFGPKDKDLKAVYASWQATITTKDGKPVSVTGSLGDYVLYTGAKEMKFGYANAFQFDPNASVPEATHSDSEIHLELTIASIPEMLKCRDKISAIRADRARADVDIKVNSRIFKAHKFILAARSKEFADMFKANANNSGSVRVKGTTPKAFESLLAGIYYESWDFLSDMNATINVLKLAERYGVADLKQYCDEALAQFTKTTNVFKILPLALRYNSVATKAACVEILVASEGWKIAKEWMDFKKRNVEISYSIAEAIGECCKNKGQLSREIASAPTAKLSATWPIDDYAKLLESSEPGKVTKLPHLAALSHYAFPGLTWEIQLYPRGLASSTHQNTCMFLWAYFGSAMLSVRAEATLTVVARDTNTCLTESTEVKEYLYDRDIACYASFPLAEAQSVRQLEVKLDLTLVNHAELLKCREMVRGLLSENEHAELIFSVEGKPFSVHRAILAKRCDQFLETVPVGTTADAFEAFLGAIYSDSFKFLSESDWKLTLGVLELSATFMAADLKEFCDLALADLIPTLKVSELLKILPVAVRHTAPSSKAACTEILAEKKADESAPDFQAICDVFQELGIGVSVPTSNAVVHRAPEAKLDFTWRRVPGADVSKAIASRPPGAVCPEPFLEHKAFAGLKWQLEYYPRGNSLDSEHKPGFASLYLKAIFGQKYGDVKGVYASWTATITFTSGKEVIIPFPALPEFNVYSGKREAKFGYANAFQWEEYNTSAQPSNSANPIELSLDIRLDLTIASIPEILKCHGLISSLHSDEKHADVDIDVDGNVVKAHKFLLAARSEVFAGTFRAAMKENQTGIVEVKGTTLEAFKAFLSAVYCNCWDFLANKDATMKVLELAERYGVADLKRYCDDALAHFANKDNVFDVLSHAALHNATATKAACVKILFASEGLLASRGWADFKENFKNIAFDVVEATGDYYRTLKH